MKEIYSPYEGTRYDGQFITQNSAQKPSKDFPVVAFPNNQDIYVVILVIKNLVERAYVYFSNDFAHKKFIDLGQEHCPNWSELTEHEKEVIFKVGYVRLPIGSICIKKAIIIDL
jgi:hypothetical protein